MHIAHETMVRSHMLSARAGRNLGRTGPGPPSSQSASEAQLHVSAHMGEHQEAGSAGRSEAAVGAICRLGAYSEHGSEPGAPSLERESVEV